jgi:hypothetical protein
MMIAFGAIVGVPVAEVVIRPPNAGISLPSVVEEQRFVSRKMEVPTPPPRRTGRFFA